MKKKSIYYIFEVPKSSSRDIQFIITIETKTINKRKATN